MTNRARPSSELLTQKWLLALLISTSIAGYLIDVRFLIYGCSFLFHLLNIKVFVFRDTSQASFQRASLLLRTVAFAILGVLLWPFILAQSLVWWAFIPISMGILLQWSAIKALGMERTYYGVELGVIEPKQINTFPYSTIPHPMALGILLQLAGLYFLLPPFHATYPFLIAGHIALTMATAIIEHTNFHVVEAFFTAQHGQLKRENERKALDWLRQWSLDSMASFLHKECSMHQYVKTLPKDVIEQIDTVRYAKSIFDTIHKEHPNSQIIPMPQTDEYYISRYNYDNGGDQGLFDKHYDGNLRFLPGMSVVRSLIYISSDDHLEVVFDDSQKRFNMKTYDFGILDFHRERHWVEGSYNPEHPPRILLKCNYYLQHKEPAFVTKAGIGINVLVFYVVKAAMEYSKSPKNVPQRMIGLVCNFFRRINNISSILPMAVIILLVFLSVRLLMLPFQAFQ